MHKETPRYTAEDVVTNGDSKALKVKIGGKELLLPALTVGDETIFIFDPNKTEVGQAGGAALLDLLSEHSSALDVKTSAIFRVLTPQSDKSTEMITNVTHKLHQKTNREFRLDPYMFLKAKSRGELERKLGENALIVDYSPITRKSSFMGISEENAMILWAEHTQGVQFLQLDDVISTGATVRAIEMLVAQVLRDSEAAASVPVFAVAREIPEHISLENDPENWSYSIIIPVLAALTQHE